MKKTIRLTESDLARIVKIVINEQSPVSGQAPINYSASGSYYYDGDTTSPIYKIAINVKDSQGNVILAKSEQTGNLTIQQLYQRIIKNIQQELSNKKISGVVLPKIEQLQKMQGSSDVDLTATAAPQKQIGVTNSDTDISQFINKKGVWSSDREGIKLFDDKNQQVFLIRPNNIG